MIGTDGGASTVREQLGIGMSGHPALTYTTNVIFRCPDLRRRCTTRARAIASSSSGRKAPGSPSWRSTAATASACRSSARPTRSTHTEADIRAALVRAMGKDFDYEILSVLRWVRRELVADSYGTERVFLAGDSVHLTSPTGALGMNTGMQDAVDLGWKLDAVLQGWGGPNLLATYEIERKPVAVRNIKASTDNLRAHAGAAHHPQAAAGSLPAGAGGRRRAQGLWRVVHRADEPRVVHERLPPRLSLRRFADRRGRTARRRRRSKARPIPRSRGRARARRMCGCRTGARRSISMAAALCCCASARMRRRARACEQAAAAAACRSRSSRSTCRRCSRPTSAGSCWCGRTAMSPGATTPSRTTRARSSIACAARGAIDGCAVGP